MLTRRLALGLGPEGIRVNGVAPGVVPSRDVGGRDRLDRGHRRAPACAQTAARSSREDVARAVLFLASAQARLITGTILNVDAGYTLGMILGELAA